MISFIKYPFHSPSELADIEDPSWYMVHVYDLPFLNYLTVFSIPKPYIIKGKENYTHLDKNHNFFFSKTMGKYFHQMF